MWKSVSQILYKLLTYYETKLRYRVVTHWFIFKSSLIRISVRRCAILTEVLHVFLQHLDVDARISYC
jgi:hypothetical protein